MSLYPANVIRKAEKTGIPPRCIFVPSRELIRRMMRSLLEHENGFEEEERWLIKFGLIDKLNNHMQQK
jgi:hypothetical protein